jgi:hypothetical protein
MIDKVAEYPGPAYLQVVYLHGQASKPEHGLIFSETQYASAYRTTHLHWYYHAGSDYIAQCPVFIGTRLDERILWSQIERAKRDTGSGSGLGFVITPDEISDIKRESLQRRGLFHVRATLEELVLWIKEQFPNGYTPANVAENNAKISGKLDEITHDDVNAVNNLMLIDRKSFL